MTSEQDDGGPADDLGQVEATLTNEEKLVLKALAALGESEPEALTDETGLDELVQVMNAASWLQAKGLVRTSEDLRRVYTLDKEGRRCVEHQLPERRALDALAGAGGSMPMADLTQLETLEAHERGVAVGQLKAKGLVGIEDGTIALTETGLEAARGKLPEEPILEALADGEADEAALKAISPDGFEHFTNRPHLFKRRDVPVRRVRLTTRGEQMAQRPLERVEQVNRMTAQYLRSGAWRDQPLRPYDVKAFAPAAYPGRRHPLRDIIEKCRQIYLEMGFTEIAGHYVRSAFWNLDALFIPQDHPAREMQDTFYLEDPARVPLGSARITKEIDYDAVERVKAVHENGWETGSTGWGGTWSEDEASQLLLRTHTTVDTISHLAMHPEAPQRIFEVGRVFRKERLDATHLPEFHQVEGIVVEEEASLDMLIGLLRTFYRKMGFDDVRVRPAYFPYTEPSLEVEVHYHDQWLELGGAGIFRPEVTEPLGVEHPVLAWGLGLERLAMLILGLKDIRELYMSDVDWLRKAELIW